MLIDRFILRQKKEVQRHKEVLTKIFGQPNVIRLEYRFLNHKALAIYLKLEIVLVKDVIEIFND